MDRISNGRVDENNILETFIKKKSEYEILKNQLSSTSIKNGNQMMKLILEKPSISETTNQIKNNEKLLLSNRNETFSHNKIEQRNLQNDNTKKFEIEVRELTNNFKNGPNLYNKFQLQESINQHREENHRLTNELDNLLKELEEQCNRFGIVLSPDDDSNSLDNDSLNRLITNVITEENNNSIQSDYQLLALKNELDHLEKATRELKEEIHNLHI